MAKGEVAQAARPGSADDAEPSDAGSAPLGFAQVAFAGHSRAEDLPDEAAVARGLAQAWDLLRRSGLTEARLLCGYAGGSDVAAVSAWRAAGFDQVQLVLPFLDPEAAPAGADDALDGATRLDGAAARRRLRSPHLAQARWIIAAADLLVVLWNGAEPRGSGGTADSVRLALQHGLPVLWVRPSGEPLRLIRPEHVDEDCGFGELIAMLAADEAPIVVDATPEAIRRSLGELGLQGEALSPPADLAPETLPWPWRSYAGFRRWLGGKRAPLPAVEPPADLVAQPGFQLMTRVRDAAAREARLLGAIHRSKQIILLAIAIAMAIAGSSSGAWPELKPLFASIELILGASAYLVWRGSDRAGHHLLWGTSRKRAEDLRLERAAWAIGLSTAPHDPLATNARVARQARRLAGLPSGPFDEARIHAWGAWIVHDLLDRQAAYHGDQASVSGRISHRVHLTENVSFGILMVLLAAYLVAAVAVSWTAGHSSPWLSRLVLIAGGIVPAIGAACLALEATLSLHDQAHRSRVLQRQLDRLKRDLGPAWSLEELQSVTRAAIKLQRAQEDLWSEDVGRRRLFRGG